jgi:hypothetical protein
MRFYILAASFLLTLAGQAGNWALWESPYRNAEVLDQRQTAEDSGYAMQGAAGVGQTFTPRATPLVRLDLRVKNRADVRPGLLRLWKWAGTPAATRMAPPLFEDVIDLTGRDSYQLRAFYPNLPVEVGAVYYVECSRPTGNGYYLLGAKGDRDLYPDGTLYINDVARAGKDLWFKTYTTPRAAPPPPLLVPSDPALPWTPPGEPGPAVTRADYLAVITDAAAYARRYTTSTDAKYAYCSATYDAVLYRETKDEQYAKNVAAILRNAVRYRAANPPAAIGFEWMEYPAIAYLLALESPSLTADDHAAIKNLLLDSARKHWPLREHGAMNRSLGSAVTYLLVTRLYPDAPEAAAWRAYAEEVWQEFWVPRDTDEDSGHYVYLGWRYILEYAMLSGKDDAVWADPAFKALVERTFQHFSPLGADAGFGDALGWAVEWPTAIWLFEKAAAKWRDGKYRWLAQRIFAYHRDHLRDEKLHIAIYQDTISLAFASIEADETLKPVQPEMPRELLAARQERDDVDWTPRKTESLGFTFTPTASPLVKLELKARGTDPKPITVKLWKWQEDYATTTAVPPLFQDTFTCGAAYAVKAFTPYLPLERGASYYLECGGSAAFELAGTKEAMKGAAIRYRDATTPGALWFRTATLSPAGSVVTTRRQATLLPTGQRNMGWYRFEESMAPEKLILRSGYGMDDLFASFNLLSAYGHGHVELGALCQLTDGGAVLLHANDYRDDAQDQDESMPVVRRYAGGTMGEPDTRVTMAHFADYRRATVAWADFVDPHGWGVRQQRRFLFAKNRFLLVRDRFTLPEKLHAAVGPVWHGYDVARTTGDNWFDLYWREPRGLAWKYKNPERYVLLWLAPRAGTTVDAWKEPSYNPQYTTAPYVIAQQRIIDAKAETTAWFDSLLLPHGKELAPEAAAANVKVLHDDGVAIALQVTARGERWLVVDNPTDKRLTAPGLETDAHHLLARTQPGKPDYLLARAATTVKWGAMAYTWAVPVTVEIGGE